MMRKRALLLGAVLALIVSGLGAPDLAGQMGPLIEVTPSSLDEAQTTLDVAAVGDNSFVVLWGNSDSGGPPDAQRFKTSGEPIENEQIDPNSCGNFKEAVLASRLQDSFWVACSFANEARSLKVVRVDLGERMGQPVEVNPGFSCRALDIAGDSEGGFVLVCNQEGGLSKHRFDDNGNEQSEAFQTFDSPLAANPVVAVGDDGSGVVTWDAGLVDRDIFAGVFEPGGAPLLDGMEPVNLLVTGSQRRPTVAILPTAPEQSLPSFLVLWESDLGLSTGSGIFARRFEKGVGEPEEFQVNSLVDGNQIEPQIAVGSDGNVLTVWEDEEQGRISVQLLNPQGFPIGGQWDVDEDGDEVDGENAVSSRPRIAALSDGRFVVVWQRKKGDDFDVMARIVDPPATAPCIQNKTTLCLHGGRYRVEVDWQDPKGDRVPASTARPVSPGLGYFWFLDPDNVELLVSIDDDSAVLKAVGLTTLGAALTVTDTWTGRTVRYPSQSGEFFVPLQDGESFRPDPRQPRMPQDSVRGSELGGPTTIYSRSVVTAEIGECEDALSLGRFDVEVRFGESDEVACAYPITEAAGTFSLSSTGGAEALDVVVKILDLCDTELGQYWLFAAGLTTAAVTVTVRDMSTHKELAVLSNQAGLVFQPVFQGNNCSGSEAAVWPSNPAR